MFEPETFETVKAWLARIPNQIDGPRGPLTETGMPYREFHAVGIARPADVEVVERFVAAGLRARLESYFADRSGTIVWRMRLEYEIVDLPQPAKYHNDGPDMDFVLDRRCTLDREWKGIKAYCRLYRAMTPDEAVTHG